MRRVNSNLAYWIRLASNSKRNKVAYNCLFVWSYELEVRPLYHLQTYIASKTKLTMSLRNVTVRFWFRGYIGVIRTELQAPAVW